MRIKIVLNNQGGTLRTMDLDAFESDLTAQFSQHRHDVSIRTVSGPEIEEAIKDAIDSDADALIVGGGDGTVSTAAKLAANTKTALGILPAGTMNLFARALSIPLDLQDAAKALANGHVTPVDLASANGEIFVHHYTVGLHPEMLRQRERMTYRSRIGKILASIRAAFGVASRPPHFTAIIEMPGDRRKVETTAISVSNNRFEEGHLPYPGFPNDGELGLYLADAKAQTEVIRLGADAILGTLDRNDSVEVEKCTTLTLHFPNMHKNALASIDGELRELEPEVSFKILPGVLNALVPQGAEKKEG